MQLDFFVSMYPTFIFRLFKGDAAIPLYGTNHREHL